MESYTDYPVILRNHLALVGLLFSCSFLYGETNFTVKPDSTTLPFETGFELRYGFGINNPNNGENDLEWKDKRSIDFFMDFPLKGNWQLEMGFGFSQTSLNLQGQDLTYGNVRMKMLPKYWMKNKRLGLAFGGFLGFLNTDAHQILSSGTELDFSKFYLGPEAFLSFRLIDLPHLRTYLKAWGNFTALPVLDIIEPNAEDVNSQRALFLQAALGFTFR
ncbi:MAG: hypothetical protein R2879_03295 [Saprospiraceae bacterium]